LFRALKTRGKTPKYGILYNSTYIGKAKKEDKGKVSRILANKTSLAVRLDNFSDNESCAFGDVLRKQLEEKLAFYAGRVKETKTNDEWVAEAVDSYKASLKVEDSLKRKSSKQDKNNDMDDEEVTEKKKKKKNKKKKEDEEMEESIEKLENLDIDEEPEKKKKKKKSKKD